MALKGDRQIETWEINFTCSDVASPGHVLCFGTAGSGVGFDTAGTVALKANSSGNLPVGVLVAPVVNIDQTRYHRNWHKVEQVVGEKVPLVRRGYLCTNLIVGTPTAGAWAYLASSGYIQPTASTAGGKVATPPVGQFKSILDEGGYATVYFNMPTFF